MQTEDKEFYTRQESKLLKDYDGVIRLVKGQMVSRYGAELVDEMIPYARGEYQRLIPELPYVGGKPPLTQFVITTGWCLALYRAMQKHALSAHESG